MGPTSANPPANTARGTPRGDVGLCAILITLDLAYSDVVLIFLPTHLAQLGGYALRSLLQVITGFSTAQEAEIPRGEGKQQQFGHIGRWLTTASAEKRVRFKIPPSSMLKRFPKHATPSRQETARALVPGGRSGPRTEGD